MGFRQLILCATFCWLRSSSSLSSAATAAHNMNTDTYTLSQTPGAKGTKEKYPALLRLSAGDVVIRCLLAAHHTALLTSFLERLDP